MPVRNATSTEQSKTKTIVIVGKNNVKKRKRNEPLEYLRISSDSEDLNDHEKNVKITRVGPPKGKRKAVDTNGSNHGHDGDQHPDGVSSLRPKREEASPTIKSQSTSTQDGQRTRVSESEHGDLTMSYIRRVENQTRGDQLEYMPSPLPRERAAITERTDATAIETANAGTHVRERETGETRRTGDGLPHSPAPASTRSPLAIAQAQQPSSRSQITVSVAVPASTSFTTPPTPPHTSATPLPNPPLLELAPTSIPTPAHAPAPAHSDSLPTTLPALRTHLTRLKMQLTEQESSHARKREEISRLRTEADREEEAMWEMRREVAECGLRMVRMEREEREREREGAGERMF